MIGISALAHLFFLQAIHQPLAQIENIGGPFPQVGIVHLGEDVGVFQHGGP